MDYGKYSEGSGYRTVAMHPYPGENWNRNTCYTNMGFDEFLDGDYYEGSEQLRYYTSDQADFEKLIQVVEEKKDPQEKLFLFNVTMQITAVMREHLMSLTRQYG